MSTPGSRFDLLSQPWLPIVDAAGHREVGLREALTRAREIRSLLGDEPMQQLALLRLLIAVTTRALADPQDRAEAWRTGALPLEPIETYLDRHAARFDLLDPYQPFLQVPDLESTSSKDLDVSDLTPRSKHLTTDTGRAVSLAQAARGLVWLQSYAAAGITGATIGDPRADRGKVYPIGAGWCASAAMTTLQLDTLAHTLIAHLPRPDAGELAMSPAPWETPLPIELDERIPASGIDLLTWPSRRVLLATRVDLDQTPIVTGALVSAGYPVPEASIAAGSDPMLAWSTIKRGQLIGWTPYDPAGRLGISEDGATYEQLVLPRLLSTNPTDRAALTQRPPVVDLPQREAAPGWLPDRVELRSLWIEPTSRHRTTYASASMGRTVLPATVLTDPATTRWVIDQVHLAHQINDAYTEFRRLLTWCIGGQPDVTDVQIADYQATADHLIGRSLRAGLAALDPIWVQQACRKVRVAATRDVEEVPAWRGRDLNMVEPPRWTPRIHTRDPDNIFRPYDAYHRLMIRLKGIEPTAPLAEISESSDETAPPLGGR